MRRLPGEVPDAQAIPVLPRRDRILISACLAIITVLAWGYLALLDRRMSASMQYDTMMAAMGMAMTTPWAAADVAFTLVMWAVMMVGMMAGSAAPVLLLFGAARTRREPQGAVVAVLAFGLGYLAVWVAFSAVATLAQWGLHGAAMLSPAGAASSPRLAGAILVAAGVYQVTPVKGACLAQCRSPLGFLLGNWRDGNSGAFKMGVRHGAYCLGCCWALMCVLFVVGVMNLAWVAVLSVFVLAEKSGPAGAVVARVGGAGMMLAGLLVLAHLA